MRSLVSDRLDVLVLNAGVGKAEPIADYTVQNLDNFYATNVRAAIRLGVPVPAQWMRTQRYGVLSQNPKETRKRSGRRPEMFFAS